MHFFRCLQAVFINFTLNFSKYKQNKNTNRSTWLLPAQREGNIVIVSFRERKSNQRISPIPNHLLNGNVKSRNLGCLHVDTSLAEGCVFLCVYCNGKEKENISI
jgi:hypothetical protein